MARTAKKKTKVDRLNKLFLEACAAGDEELAHSTAETLLDILATGETDLPEPEPTKPIPWNTDPKWLDYCERVLEPLVRTIAYKSTTDLDLREDCENEARIAIYQLRPSNVRDYTKYKAGQITECQWQTRLLKYCKNAIRNSIWSYLDSPKTGNWNIGRTARIRNKDGQRVKVHTPARYTSLEELAASGFQVNDQGEVTWHFSGARVQVTDSPDDQPQDSQFEWPEEDDNG